MHHTTTIGPVKDEDGKDLPFKTFQIKGLVESNNPTELLTDAEFAALTLDDANFTRTAGGGFEYSFAVHVDQSKLARIVAEQIRQAKAKAASDAEKAKEQQADQHKAALQEAYDKGKKDAELEVARAAGAASVKEGSTKVQ